MTEIPEHLLKRSKERRAAISGEDTGDGGDSGGESSTAPVAAAASSPPAAAAAAPPPAVEEKPPPPPPPYVQAAQRRQKIPYWAMAVLAGLPLWAYIYQGTLEAAPDPNSPETLGAELYEVVGGCAGCHGAGGGGGVGPAFTGGTIYETWPDFAGHFRWVRLGSNGWQQEVGDTYGATNTPVGGGMPGFSEAQLTDAELALIIWYERAVLGGTPPSEDEAELLEQLGEMAAEAVAEEEEMTLAELINELEIAADTATQQFGDQVTEGDVSTGDITE